MAQCNAAPKQSASAVEQPATAAKQTSRVAKQADASLHDSTQKTAKPAFEVQSAPNDSLLVMQHISKALKYKTSIAQDIDADRQRQLLLLHIARGFCGIPYVAKTLENDSKENLVVNLRQLDCTTYVENVLAVYECVKHNRTSYADYLHFLRRIRYVDGNVDYSARQHYFTEWIEENTKDGFVREINTPNPPFNPTDALYQLHEHAHRRLSDAEEQPRNGEADCRNGAPPVGQHLHVYTEGRHQEYEAAAFCHTRRRHHRYHYKEKWSRHIAYRHSGVA